MLRPMQLVLITVAALVKLSNHAGQFLISCGLPKSSCLRVGFLLGEGPQAQMLKGQQACVINTLSFPGSFGEILQGFIGQADYFH